MKYRHYFWDFDGTLFDSYPHTLRCCWDVMEENGLTDGWDRESVLRWLLVTFGDMKREVGMPDNVYASFLERTAAGTISIPIGTKPPFSIWNPSASRISSRTW